MQVPWSEAERIHWIIGQKQIARRGSDDSFRTIRVDLPLPQVDGAELQAPIQEQDQQQRGVKKPKFRWSGDEETSLIACKRARMGWKEISDRLPGRTPDSCETYYRNQCESGPAWPQERKNELSKLYKNHKPSMWAKIGEELKVPWYIAEDMHWSLGAVMRVDQAGVTLSYQAVEEFLPPRAYNAEVHQHRDQEHDLVQQSSGHSLLFLSQTEPAPISHEGQTGISDAVTLPSFADFVAGVEL
ncbi:hypothetical protein E4U17_001919 [Claviceps sp. LM77 group G4]|nr:hypothetical protein E4U17_001919 [Claviceps sp. LM77 group G4]KAG6079641.1 hypothetical protein E4U16_000880 [Claviceps sp. LM84 group G4]KAG6082939.1 hypothetical protein E4U33_005220 [Claviceps sp. LM78 group G4]